MTRKTPSTTESPSRVHAEVVRGGFVAMINRRSADDDYDVAIIQDPPNAWIFPVGGLKGTIKEAKAFALGSLKTLIALKARVQDGHGFPFRLDERD